MRPPGCQIRLIAQTPFLEGAGGAAAEDTMTPHDHPIRPDRRRQAAVTVRLLVMLAGGGMVWSWSAGPAVARQVTPESAAPRARLTPPVGAGALTTRRDRPAGNAGNAE